MLAWHRGFSRALAQLLLPYCPKSGQQHRMSFSVIAENLLAELVEAPVGPRPGQNHPPLVGALKDFELGTHVPVQSYLTPVLHF